MNLLGMSEGTLGTLRAEASQIVWARLLQRMSMPAPLAMLTEATSVPWALGGLLLWTNVEEDALLIATLAEIGKIPAFWHPIMIQPVQKIAAVTLFAEATQPVLAHDAVPPWVRPHIGWRDVWLAVETKHGIDIYLDVHRALAQ